VTPLDGGGHFINPHRKKINFLTNLPILLLFMICMAVGSVELFAKAMLQKITTIIAQMSYGIHFCDVACDSPTTVMTRPTTLVSYFAFDNQTKNVRLRAYQ